MLSDWGTLNVDFNVVAVDRGNLQTWCNTVLQTFQYWREVLSDYSWQHRQEEVGDVLELVISRSSKLIKEHFRTGLDERIAVYETVRAPSCRLSMGTYRLNVLCFVGHTAISYTGRLAVCSLFVTEEPRTCTRSSVLRHVGCCTSVFFANIFFFMCVFCDVSWWLAIMVQETHTCKVTAHSTMRVSPLDRVYTRSSSRSSKVSETSK